MRDGAGPDAGHARRDAMSKTDKSLGVGALAGRLLQQIPGGKFAQEQFDRIERRLLSELKQRMDRIEGNRSSVSVLAVAVQQRVSGASSDLIGESPARLLRELLELSGEQDRNSAKQAFFTLALSGLLPDEARILAALSDGASHPSVDVLIGPRLGQGSRPVVEGICSVGKTAGVHCPDLTPVYLRRLRAWGLLDVHPEDPTQELKYQLLETDTGVRTTVERFSRGSQRARIVRYSLKISELGAALWAAGRIEALQTF